MSEANVNEVKKERGARKTRIGIVVSDKMDKTLSLIHISEPTRPY